MNFFEMYKQELRLAPMFDTDTDLLLAASAAKKVSQQFEDNRLANQIKLLWKILTEHEETCGAVTTHSRDDCNFEEIIKGELARLNDLEKRVTKSAEIPRGLAQSEEQHHGE